MQPETPNKNHQWLNKLLGDWESEMECEPGKKSRGTESFRSIGGLWYIGEGKGEMPGGASHTMIMSLGYDTLRDKFVGTWIGSMMSNLWVYDGKLEGNRLTLSAEGPRFDKPGALAQYRDVIEFVNDDYRTLTSFMLGDDGNWNQFMQAHYRRLK
ncbi:MAG TPA: DUF1579 domain-containing protein [Phycisphaerales bacterium]|nr:DUF1579 domain-containing protein [Phycisphaerales bacterium]